jgi:hypothetical protein
MLQGFPAHTVHSALHFEDFAYWPPQPSARGKKAGKRSVVRAEASGEEEDYVFV